MTAQLSPVGAIGIPMSTTRSASVPSQPTGGSRGLRHDSYRNAADALLRSVMLGLRTVRLLLALTLMVDVPASGFVGGDAGR